MSSTTMRRFSCQPRHTFVFMGGAPARSADTDEIGFRAYAERYWLPNHRAEASTREGYTYALYTHILPAFGQLKLIDIVPTMIKQWQTGLSLAGYKPANRRMLKMVLSAILSSAVDDGIIPANPCHRVKTDPVPVKPLKIITPAQLESLLDAIPDAMPRLLVETAGETGMRWGELTELRSNDFDRRTGVFTVSRAVVHLTASNQVDGQPFRVKNYPKGGEYRLIKVAAAFAQKITTHIEGNNLQSDDLLFWHELPVPSPRWRGLGSEPGRWGYTGPNPKGRIYAHGTLTAYTNGKCRCQYCRDAMAAYRHHRRTNGKDGRPCRTRTTNTDGHIPNRWFTDTILRPAIAKAGLPPETRMHRIRHAHASWLLNGGADLMIVKERLGHASIQTTERYLHTLDNADTTALTALAKVRGSEVARSGDLASVNDIIQKSSSLDDVIEQMAKTQAMIGRIVAEHKHSNTCDSSVCSFLRTLVQKGEVSVAATPHLDFAIYDGAIANGNFEKSRPSVVSASIPAWTEQGSE